MSSNENQCVFANIKSNISATKPRFLYSITSDKVQGDSRPYIHWQGQSNHTDQELMGITTNVAGEGRQADELLSSIKLVIRV
jgi:hypothetical protein